MQYPQDCGVSAIRFHLREPDHPLARTAAAALSVPHSDAGYLVCQCGGPDWWRLHTSSQHAVLFCGCNGSSLPLYIGPPPRRPAGSYDITAESVARCANHPQSFAAAAIAVGYADPVPALGTLDAERAQELVVALACRLDTPAMDDSDFGQRALSPVADLTHSFIAWALRLPAPYPITGGETWLAAIHYIRRT